MLHTSDQIRIPKFCVLLLFLIINIHTLSGQRTKRDVPVDYHNLAYKLTASISIVSGFGLESFDVVQNASGEQVTLSPGGGWGVQIGSGFWMTNRLHIGVDLGIQSSKLSQSLDLVEGKFPRSYILATLKYRFPFGDLEGINIGGGFGTYWKGEVKVDGVGAGGGRNSFHYKNAGGYHVAGEYEGFFKAISTKKVRWSWRAAIRYSRVIYDLKSVLNNGVDIPLGLLSEEVRSSADDLDGSGIDLILSMNLSF